jgi:hypothetical protein
MVRHPISYGSTKPTPLNFEEICPTWSNKLKADLDQDDLHILIRKPEMCIVGEAWGYTSRYLGYRVVYLIPFIGCWKCIKYGNKIGKIAKQYNELCRSYLQPTIDDFVDHWNEKHQDRCASASNRQMVKEYIIDNYRVYHAMISLV